MGKKLNIFGCPFEIWWSCEVNMWVDMNADLALNKNIYMTQPEGSIHKGNKSKFIC